MNMVSVQFMMDGSRGWNSASAAVIKVIAFVRGVERDGTDGGEIRAKSRRWWMV
jgi:hypothetical protein